MADSKGNKLKLSVVTPYQNFYDGEVSSLILPTTDGDIGFMAGHTPMVVALKPGIATVRVDDDTARFTVSEGFAEISAKSITVVCNSAEYPDDIKFVKMCKSYKEAQEDLERSKLIADKEARLVATKEIQQKVDRFKARRHIIEMYGTQDQKERLAKRLEEYGIN